MVSVGQTHGRRHRRTFSALHARLGLVDAVETSTDSKCSPCSCLLRCISNLTVSIRTIANVDSALKLAICCDDDAVVAAGSTAVALQLVLCGQVCTGTGRRTIHLRRHAVFWGRKGMVNSRSASHF
jgi:hypothetical protein